MDSTLSGLGHCRYNVPLHGAMVSAVGDCSTNSGWRTGPQTVVANLLTNSMVATVATVATLSVRFEGKQMAGGVPHTGCTIHLSTLSSQSPRKPLQHQVPRSATRSA
ncbi:unnamed protein product [Phytophthora fragariaefolia]|uniref:Unnamed protein product n=1 Tax=Phytophthora fragariaefolia TaxID=1490495 RepID=A0A9W7CUW6_9STRA|nr:unnamed protein product [Phytophthora fragariaefolia]